MSDMRGMDRREFVKLFGGGILVAVNLGPLTLFNTKGAVWDQGRGYPEDINAYLHIAEDGQVTLFSGKIEMGQGVMTSLSQMAAEDLGVSMESMQIVMGDTDRCPWDMGTFGSMTTRFFGPAVRAAAAKARLILTDLAAERLGVSRDSLSVETGVVFVTGDRDRSVSYGALAKGEAITHTVDGEAVLRAVEDFTVMGQSPLRMDGVEKVTGAAEYAGDIRLPNMLYARILRPPAHGATLLRVDTSAAEAMPDVVVVNEDGLVAVLCADPEMAGRALEAIDAAFDEPVPDVDTESIFQHLVDTAPEPNTPEQGGDLASGRQSSAKTFEHTYYNAYVAHAPMEPHTAVAEIRDGKATVWASTQAPFGVQTAVARGINFPPENVRILTPYVGGGFGGKTSGQQAVEAARLAQITGRPVQVAWTRAEEFFYDTFRPAATIKIASGMDDSGQITALGLSGLRSWSPWLRCDLRGPGSLRPGVRRMGSGSCRDAPLRGGRVESPSGKQQPIRGGATDRDHGIGRRHGSTSVSPDEYKRRTDAERPEGDRRCGRLGGKAWTAENPSGPWLGMRDRCRNLCGPRRRSDGGRKHRCR